MDPGPSYGRSTVPGEQYGVALPKGSPLLKVVDSALGSLIADSTVQRLQKKWLTANLSALPVLH